VQPQAAEVNPRQLQSQTLLFTRLAAAEEVLHLQMRLRILRPVVAQVAVQACMQIIQILIRNLVTQEALAPQIRVL
jgi:hypothetical protein